VLVTGLPSSLGEFIGELKRRKVVRVAMVYAMVTFIVVQVADLMFVRLGIPDWAVTLVVWLAVLCFPVALVLAWAFEVTPAGVRRADPADPLPGPGGAKYSTGLLGAGLVLATALGAGLGGWYLATAAPDAGTSQPSAGYAAASFPAEALDRSIAVLPFANLSPDIENAYFADGVSEEIRAALSRVGDLLVTSRTAVERYREGSPAIDEIADDLRVAYLLEGTARRAGDEIRIVVWLVDPRSGRNLWGETYDRSLTLENLFAVQSDIAREVARALQAELSPSALQAMERPPTNNLTAYELYLQALPFRRGGDTTPVRSIRLLRQALELDPEFALAEATLADVFSFLHSLDGRAEYMDSIQVHVRRARALDPDLPEALLVEAQTLHTEERYEEAEHLLRRAVELSPSHQMVVSALAHVYRDLGEYPEAVAWARRAVAGAPSVGIHYAVVGTILVRVGAFEEARSWFEAGDDLGRYPPPYRYEAARAAILTGRTEAAAAHRDIIRETVAGINQPRGWQILADLELALGELGAAAAYYERQRALAVDEGPDEFTGLAYLYARDGRVAEAEPLLREAEEKARRWLVGGGRSRANAYLTLARIHAVRGDPDAAIDALREAVAARWDGYYEARLDPRLEILAGDPRYEALLAGVRGRLDRLREPTLAETS
jgi:TolB-like protein/Flp pilus assembly protein TadD